MNIDLSQLDKEQTLSVDTEFLLEEDELDNALVESPVRVHLTGTLRATGQSFVLTGRLSCHATVSCARCLEPVSWSTQEELMLEYRNSQEMEDSAAEIVLEQDELGVSFIDTTTIDLRELAIEQTELALPMRVLCRQECAGLCPQCGGNRNTEGSCSCAPQTDKRWAALEDLKGRLPH